jgi:hypothetical protein
MQGRKTRFSASSRSLQMTISWRRSSCAVSVAADHWKNRQIIIEGGRQALIAVEFLKNNLTFLDSLGKRAISARIQDVQGVVLTNEHTFNGWTTENVPVVSTGGLMSIVRGAQVFYESTRGKLLAKERFASSEHFTSSDFLDLLRNPVDWRASGEQIEVTHHNIQLSGITWHIPSSLGALGIFDHELNNDLP